MVSQVSQVSHRVTTRLPLPGGTATSKTTKHSPPATPTTPATSTTLPNHHDRFIVSQASSQWIRISDITSSRAFCACEGRHGLPYCSAACKSSLFPNGPVPITHEMLTRYYFAQNLAAATAEAWPSVANTLLVLSRTPKPAPAPRDTPSPVVRSAQSSSSPSQARVRVAYLHHTITSMEAVLR